MGATIRREPVTSAIPAAKKYQYYDILEFKGIEQSDNPFNTSTGSCSDCLNVYVDKEGSLTTRPRIDLKDEQFNKLTNLGSLILGGVTYIGVYGLIDNRYLIHYKENSSDAHGKFRIYAPDEASPLSAVITNSDTLCPITRCKVFEQEDVIYILTGSSYLQIKDNTLSEVEGYIPLIMGAASKVIENQRITEDVKIEDYNLLTDKYRKGFLWSEHNNLSLNFINDEIIDATRIFDIHIITMFDKILAYYEDDTFIAKLGAKLYYGKYDSTTKTFDVLNNISYNGGTYDVVVAKNSKCLLVSKQGSDWTFYTIENNIFVEKYNTQLNSLRYNKISPNGGYVYTLYTINTTDTLLYKLDISGVTPITTTPQSSAINDVIFSDDDSVIAIKNNAQYYVNADITTNNWTMIGSSGNTGNVYFNHDGTILAWQLYNDTIWYYYNKNFNTHSQKQYDVTINKMFFTSNGFFTKNYYIDNNDYIYNLNITDINNLLYTNVGESLLVFTDKTLISNYENMYITFQLVSTDEIYSKWYARRQKFFNSLLTTRFYNQRWFAADSHIFWTNNNDPTYIPLYNYDLLGDSGYDVTGFNVISDTGMVAYTKNQLSIISPVKDRGDGNWDYSFTETKNTTGNVAVGNTITTSYTVLPLQIDYKGIFTIQQTENVVSEANVVTPITNAIMKKWMREGNNIENCKTVNYLYWTYFLLPDTDKTKIYVLDNRNLSWFYWEIPIQVMDIITKDQDVEFVSPSGTIYVFKIEDIDEFKTYDSYSMKTYYDITEDDKYLIDWKWDSQILPLGTINYSKQLVATTFILNDDEEGTDNYGLTYSFRGFRKNIYDTDARDIDGDIQYVRSKTVRSMFTRIQFLQLKMRNKQNDYTGDYSRLRLVGLGFKYRLLEANRT